MILRLLPTVIFIIVYVSVFAATPTWTSPQVFVYIPTAEYLGAIAMNYLFWCVFRCINGRNPDTIDNSASTSTTAETTTPKQEYEMPEVNNKNVSTSTEDVETVAKDNKQRKRYGAMPVSSSTRWKWLSAAVLLYIVAIVFSVVAQVIEVSGGSGGALVVYLPMCICIPLSFVFLKRALPYSQNAVDAESDRIPTEGKTACCLHL